MKILREIERKIQIKIHKHVIDIAEKLKMNRVSFKNYLRYFTGNKLSIFFTQFANHPAPLMLIVAPASYPILG